MNWINHNGIDRSGDYILAPYDEDFFLLKRGLSLCFGNAAYCKLFAELEEEKAKNKELTLEVESLKQFSAKAVEEILEKNLKKMGLAKSSQSVKEFTAKEAAEIAENEGFENLVNETLERIKDKSSSGIRELEVIDNDKLIYRLKKLQFKIVEFSPFGRYYKITW